MSDSFQILRGSSMRLSSRRVCSSGLTSSQYLMSWMPDSTIAFSTAGYLLEEPFGLLVGAEPHDSLDAGAVVPTAVEDHDLTRGGEVRDVALHVHLRLLAFGGCGQRDDTEHAWADALGDRLDRATLPCRVAALEHHADLRAGLASPTPASRRARRAGDAARADTPSPSSSGRRGCDFLRRCSSCHLLRSRLLVLCLCFATLISSSREQGSPPAPTSSVVGLSSTPSTEPLADLDHERERERETDARRATADR